MRRKYLVWFLIFLFSLIYSTYSVVRHLKFETGVFDLGYYDQFLWLASHGKAIYSSVLEAPFWVDHFFPSLFLLTPLYWIWDSPLALLSFQSFFVALGAYPIYKLSIKRTNSFACSITLVFTYLMFYGLQNAIAFDFHTVTLGPTLLAFIFWLYEEKRFKLFWLSLLIFVGLQENFFVLASAFGIFLIIHYKDFKRGIPIFLAGIVIALILMLFIIPHFFGSNYYYVPKNSVSLNFKTIIERLYIPSSKVDVVVFSLTAFGLLPLLSPAYWVILLEEFLGRFLMTTNSNWWILGFHYNAILAPILATASINSVKKFFKGRFIIPIILLLLGTLVSQIRVKTDIYKMLNKSFYDISKTDSARQVLKMIPKSASVATTNNLGAQIAHREKLIFLTNCVDNTSVWGPDCKRCFELVPDYLVADLDPIWGNSSFYPDYSKNEIIKYFKYVQDKGEYRLVMKVDSTYLLEKITDD